MSPRYFSISLHNEVVVLLNNSSAQRCYYPEDDLKLSSTLNFIVLFRERIILEINLFLNNSFSKFLFLLHNSNNADILKSVISLQ